MVFALDRPISVQQAETVHAIIGDVLVAVRITLKSRLIPADQLSKVTGIGGIYVTGNLGPQHRRCGCGRKAAARGHHRTTWRACGRDLAFSPSPANRLSKSFSIVPRPLVPACNSPKRLGGKGGVRGRGADVVPRMQLCLLSCLRRPRAAPPSRRTSTRRVRYQYQHTCGPAPGLADSVSTGGPFDRSG